MPFPLGPQKLLEVTAFSQKNAGSLKAQERRLKPPLAAALLLLPAPGDRNRRFGVLSTPVLGGEVELHPALLGTEVDVVFDQPFLAAEEADLEGGDWGVGDVGKAGPDPRDFRALLVDGVDEADEDDVDLAV